MDSGTAPTPGIGSGSAVGPPRRYKRVLAVDDDPSILELIQILLESEGHEVVASASGVGIAEQVRTVQPDLVLLDIVMQSRHGMDVLAELRLEAPNLSVILLSGAVSQVGDMPDIARALGAYDFIEKPFDAQRLIDTVNQAP